MISATHFQGIYLRLGTTWTKVDEAVYRETLRRLATAPPGIAALPDEERRVWADLAQDYERLQFGRLRQFLRSRQPEAFVGGSLLVFALTDAEVQRALYGPLP